MGVAVCFVAMGVPVRMPSLLPQEDETPDAKPDQGDPDRKFGIPFERWIEFQLEDKNQRAECQHRYGMAQGPSKSKPGASNRIRFERDEVGDGSDMIPVEGVAHAKRKTCGEE
jgi:hypothetical protein